MLVAVGVAAASPGGLITNVTTITFCVNKDSGAVRIVTVKDSVNYHHSWCKHSEIKVVWTAGTGPSGPSGPTGVGGAVVLAGGGTAPTSTTGLRTDFAFGEYYSAAGPDNSLQNPVPVGGTLSNLQVHVDPADCTTAGCTSGGGSWSFHVLLNGNVQASLTCVIPNGGSSCSDTSDTVSVAAGDLVSIKGFASNNHPVSQAISWSVELTP